MSKGLADSQPSDSTARDKQWQAFLADPAGSGYDYHEDRITVSYLPGAVLATGHHFAPLPAGQRSADRPNALLRRHSECEALSDAIAGTYGLSIYSQTYIGDTRVAGFVVPEGVDAGLVLEQLRREFSYAIKSAAYSTRGRPFYTPNDPDFLSSTADGGPQWCMHRLGFPRAWDETLGEETVLIASMDSGLNMDHEQFVNTVIDPAVSFPGASTDTVNDDNVVEDLQSHGSGVSGLIVAEMGDALTITGGAPGCGVVPFKITNDWWDASDADLIEALLLADTLGVKIVTLSFGWPHTPELESAYGQLASNGVLLIASAGNDDSDIANYPASYETVKSVGASNTTDGRISHPGWWGSNFNSDVNICAPGEDYLSCSCFDSSGPDAYQVFGGTSGAAPLVGACAALAWSVFPEWSSEEIFDALVATGMPSTGFPHSVPRVDIGNFFETYSQNFSMPAPQNLLAHGDLEIELSVNGDYSSIAGFFNGAPAGTRSAAPWQFSIDTRSVTKGSALLEFTGYSLEEDKTRSTNLFIDNTPGIFPLKASAESTNEAVQVIDAKLSNGALMNSLLFLPNSDWSAGLAPSAGSGRWQIDPSAPFAGSGSYYCGNADFSSYDAFEMDLLMLDLLDFSAVSAPSLIFDHHYNVEDGGPGYDRAMVLVSADYGASWNQAVTREGELAVYTGYLADWTRAEINLADYAGQRVHVALAFESDKSVVGENATQPAGWWVDNIIVSSDYASSFASIDGIEVTPVIGLVPAVNALQASTAEALLVGHIEYSIDFYPLGQPDSYDISSSAALAPFSVELSLPATVLPNHYAALSVQCFDALGLPGEQRSYMLPVFNLRGDINLDNMVDAADLAELLAGIGKMAGDPGYSVFMDSDLDGVITEADQAGIGYNWGASL